MNARTNVSMLSSEGATEVAAKKALVGTANIQTSVQNEGRSRFDSNQRPVTNIRSQFRAIRAWVAAA
ncbi:MAG: hypothetical protein HYY23_17160 [Verrucomicrobia bacterium]|nr:hypothetical protein [Verrucomicrobiota bacterium]